MTTATSILIAIFQVICSGKKIFGTGFMLGHMLFALLITYPAV